MSSTSAPKRGTLGAGAALLTALGCAGPPGTPDEAARPAASTSTTLEACDVRLATCQERVFSYVVGLQRRPGVVTRPVVRFASPEEVLELIEGDVPGCHGSEVGARRREFLSTIGLAAPANEPTGVPSSSVIGVKALYLHELDEVVVVDRSEAMDTPLANYVLAHEFVHAIQDQTIDLGSFVEEHGHCFDARLALVAAVEGEAVRAESIVREALFGRTATDVYLSEEAERRVERANERSLTHGPAADTAFGLFPYAYGGRWAVQQGRPDAFGELVFVAPSDTLGYLLASSEPRSAHDGAGFPAPDEAADADELGSDELGAWLVYNFSALAASSEDQVTAALEQVDAYLYDTLTFRAADGPSLEALWRTQWTDEAHAGAFRALAAQMLAEQVGESDLQVDARTVTIKALLSPAAP